MIEEYRKTLAALEALLKKKQHARADERSVMLLRTEIEEVTEVLRHLQKGESRYRWK